MIVTYSYYHKDTGLFSQRKKRLPSSVSREDLRRNCPTDHLYVVGEIDCLSKRVDIALRDSLIQDVGDEEELIQAAQAAIVEYIPEQPTDLHEWSDTEKRWKLPTHEALKDAEHKQALAELRELEATQHRRVRELLAASDPQLKALDEQIEEKRSKLISQKGTK